MTAVDHCKSNPCAHGTCHSSETGYKCSCEDGWTGQHCDEGLLQLFTVIIKHSEILR